MQGKILKVNTRELMISWYSNIVTVADLEGVNQIATVKVTKTGAQLRTGAYFLLNSPSAEFYVWYFQEDTNLGVDPRLNEKTSIKVNYLSTDTTQQIAAKTKLALEKFNTFFSSSVSTDTITITNLDKNYCSPIQDKDTTFTITITQSSKSNILKQEMLPDDNIVEICDVSNILANGTVECLVNYKVMREYPYTPRGENNRKIANYTYALKKFITPVGWVDLS